MFGNSRSRVFVAEDDPISHQIILACLEIAGYRTASARTGSHAVQAIKLAPPSAVILDIGLPGMDGFQVLQELRAHRATRKTPILMLTSYDSADSVQRAIWLGANDYILKPFNYRILLMRLERHLSRRSGRCVSPVAGRFGLPARCEPAQLAAN